MTAGVPSPTCTLIAGPNGAGKSTIYKAIDLPGVFINADDIARAIDPENPSRVSLQAGREALRLLDRALLEKADFCYETTLSSRQSIQGHAAGALGRLSCAACFHDPRQR